MMNNIFYRLLESGKPIILDGAMGTMLMEAGLTQGDPPEEWNVKHPDRLEKIHSAYIQAGSQIILTNSFGGTHFRLTMHGLQERVTELNKAAAINARAAANAAPHTVAVAGSIGPTGELFEPMGTLTFDDAKEAFAEQAAALAEGGVDLFWIETMSDLNEVKAAYEGIRSVSDLPISATMTFDTHGHTMMGVHPKKAIDAFQDLDLVVLGANCGNGPDEIEEVITAMHAANPDIILVAKANAGLPKIIKGEIIYDGTPEIMAEYALKVQRLGATLIGGCCGSTPDHIEAIAKALHG